VAFDWDGVGLTGIIVGGSGNQTLDHRLAGGMFERNRHVVPEDLDELEHVNNVTYVRWLEWITRQHNEAYWLGNEYLKSEGMVFVVVKYELNYLRPCKLGDEVAVRTAVVEANRYAHVRKYEVCLGKSQSPIFEGFGHWVCMSLRSERLSRMPAEYVARIEAMRSGAGPLGVRSEQRSRRH
jgi:acyl-CoA thioester hydrolase